MSDFPSLSFFNSLDNLDYEYQDSCESVGGSPLDTGYEFSLDRDIIPVCNDNYEESVNFQDNFLSSNFFNLSEKSNFILDFQLDEYNLPFENCDSSLPSNNLPNSESYLEPENDLESLSKELEYLKSYDQPEIGNSGNILKDFSEDHNFDKKATTTKYPITVILKKIKGKQNNLNMVAPLSIPKTTYTLVRLPGETSNTNIPEKVSVVNLNSNTILKKNKSYSVLKSEKDLKKEISPVFVNEKIPEEFKEKIPTKLSEKNNSTSDVLNYDELPFTSLKRKYPNFSKPNPVKKKAYELAPLPDPALERCRRNAINAKKNRDIKKQKMVKLEVEVEQERQEKLKLASENVTLKQKNEELQEKINFLINALENSSKPAPQHLRDWQRSHEILDKSNASSTLSW